MVRKMSAQLYLRILLKIAKIRIRKKNNNQEMQRNERRNYYVGSSAENECCILNF